MEKQPRAGAAKVRAMNITVSHCFIAVHDHDEALAFYRGALGLEVRSDVKYEGMRWVSVGPKDQPEVSIVLEPPLADPGASQADRKLMAEFLAKGFLRAVNFATDDCDGTFESIRSSGAEVLQEPMDQAYGVRDCAFRDPSGNMIRFSQKK
jgi:predicted enzyme related to lactoylglutathione lyase